MQIFECVPGYMCSTDYGGKEEEERSCHMLQKDERMTADDVECGQMLLEIIE